MQTYSAPEFAKNISEIKELTENIENKLDEADFFAKNNPKRMTHEEVFGALRRNVK